MTGRLITAEEFGRMPSRDDGALDELVRGIVVIQGPMPKARHGIACACIGARLGEFVDSSQLGRVFLRTGVVMQRNPDTVRGPDVSFFSYSRLPTVPNEYIEVPPDLAVEVLSPDDRSSKVREKIREDITAGVKLVWLVDPDARTVLVYRGSIQGTQLDETDTIDGADVLPGFSCTVADFFA